MSNDIPDVPATNESKVARLRRVLRDAGWDVAVRAINLTWVGWMAASQIVGLLDLLDIVDITDNTALDSGELAAAIAARLSAIMFLSLFLVTVVNRTRPVAKADGLGPRLMALAGTFLPCVVMLLPRDDALTHINILSAVLCALGYGLAMYALTHLNRSMSIMPEARALVTRGPYRFIRHPIYLFEQIGTVGIFLPFDPLYAIPAFAVQLFCQLQRMDNEERVLRAAFPAYATYAERTARLIPGVY